MVESEAPRYSIGVEKDRVVVRLTCAVTLEDIKAFRTKLATRTDKPPLVLIDMSQAASTSVRMADLFELCDEHSKELTLAVAVAVVYRPEHVSVQDADFARLACRNRGVRLGMFLDLESGHRWLSDMLPKSSTESSGETRGDR